MNRYDAPRPFDVKMFREFLHGATWNRVEIDVAVAHRYEITTTWTGNLGTGTNSYRTYSRDHEIAASKKSAPILGSSDPKFRGDATRYNPEEILVASLSACHMLWVLHLCADAGITVTDYVDDAQGSMVESPDGSGQFTEVVLRPRMKILEADRKDEAIALHGKAHALCFIARSVNFDVRHEPRVVAVRGVRSEVSDTSDTGSQCRPLRFGLRFGVRHV